MGILSKGITKYYDIGKTLGKGTFATVKEGCHKKTGSKVAIKIIDKKDAVFDPESLELEIATMKAVNHPSCVLLHEVYDETNKTYMVLDLITGGTVMDRIIAMDHFSEKDAAAVTADVLAAVQYLHSIGITHRDIKPENLLYASNDPNSPDYNTIKVADFGLAKFTSEQSQMKTTCGTPGYVAPEILDPYLPFTNGYGPEVDLWSLGVVLYIMLCGFPPFYDDSTAVLFKQIRKGEYSFPSPYWDDVSDEAKDIVSKVLVVEPSVRFTAQQCLDHPWITSQSEKTSKKLHSGHRAFLLIRKLPIFNNIDPACLQQVTALLRLVKVERGKAVIQAGEVGECMYFINSGTVQVLVNGNEVDRLTTGDFFGEVALTVSKQRTADVLSLGNTSAKAKSSDCVELFQLMRTDFEQVMDRFPILKTRLAQIGKARVNRASSGQSPDLGPRPSGGRASGSPQAARMDALDETKRAEPRPSPEPGRRSTEGSPSRSSQSPESKRGNKNKCKQQ